MVVLIVLCHGVEIFFCAVGTLCMSSYLKLSLGN